MANGETLATDRESLCWHCSKEQGFYENPCPHCGWTNPNVDLDKALSEAEEQRDWDNRHATLHNL